MLADKPKQNEFYICDVFDSFKDDIASMEHPVFSLSKTPDHRMLEYERNGFTIKIKPSYTGLATILDKDILLYLASSLMNAKNRGEKISKTVRFTTYDYLISTNKSIGGSQYKQIQEGLERLSGTRIQTNIKTNGTEKTKDFGILESWEIVKKDKKGKLEAIEVTLSNWFYNSILGNEVLTIDKDYFKLGKPTEKRLYELARKHCGYQVAWKITLDNLKEKLGVTSNLYTLRFNIKKIVETNHLPEYNITIENDVVMFTQKNPSKEKDISKTALLPLHVKKSDIVKVAKPGETEQQVRERLIKQAEQKGITIKAVIAELSAGKQAKSSNAKEYAGKSIADEIKKMKAATTGNKEQK